MNSTPLAQIDALRGATVLCVGDVMLDRFVYGDVTRISPEAPIPVCRVTDDAEMLGGAGNVVRNLLALGAGVRAVVVVGEDDAGRAVRAMLEALDDVDAAVLTEPGRPTTLKTRYFAAGQQLLRADRESDHDVAGVTATQALAAVADYIGGAGAVILSDYGKGLLSDAVIAKIIELAGAAGIPVIVDPKGDDYVRYRGAAILTPNRRELAEASRMRVDGDVAVVAAARHVIDGCGVGAILATRSAEGMTLVDADCVTHLPAEAREVFDVSGAGDTVIATLAASIAAGASAADAAALANAAAGIVVGKTGTAVAHADEIVNALRARNLMTGERKSVSLAAALEQVADWRRRGESIAFTNGCFDLVHPGHISLLAQARAACDRLIVGLNSDASTARLKGPDRPVQSEAARAAVLGALETVDLVVVFEDDTPLALIEALRPDVLVKGADYALDEVVGGDLVRGWGGRVVLADLAEGHSTTATIRRIGQ